MKNILYCLFFALAFLSCDDEGDTNLILPQGAPVFVQHYRNGQYPDASYDGCTDTYMQSDSPGTVYGSSQSLYIRSSSVGSESIYRTLIRFKIVGTLPSGITIKKAVLSFRLSGSYPGDDDPDPARVHVEARTYVDISAYGNPAWNDMDWNADNLFITNAIFHVASGNGTIEIPGDVIKIWLNDFQSNFGMVLMLKDETITDGRGMYSSDYTDVNYRPMLSIYYTY